MKDGFKRLFRITGHYLSCTLILLMFEFMVYGQDLKPVTGTVTDHESGEPLIGVNMFIKNTTIGAATDANGDFSLKATVGDTIVFSYLGYTRKEIVYQGQKELEIKLAPSNEMLEELVVTGYGNKQRLRDLTAPIVSIDASEIEDKPFSNLAQSLQGKIPGVNVVQSGAPGSNPIIRIRGIGSALGSPDPLYVVDGVFTRDISYLGPNDIKSVTVLKDASSAALYGVRAANGVLLIETRRGQQGANKIKYNGYMGIQSASNVLEMANAEEYVTMINEKNKILSNYDPSVIYTPLDINDFDGDTDWFDLILRNATIQSHNISITGGQESSSYSYGLGYLSQEGIVKKTKYERVNFRASGDYKVRNRVKVGYNANLAPYVNKNPGNQTNLLASAFIAPPVIAPKDADGNFTDPFDYGLPGISVNPALNLENLNYKVEGYRVILNNYAEVALLADKSLKLKTNFGVEHGQEYGRDYDRSFYVSNNLFDSIPTLSKTQNRSTSYFWDNTASYEKSFREHEVQAIAGFSFQQFTTSFISSSRQYVEDFGEPSYYLSLGATDGQTNNDGGTKIRGLSYFGRLFYSYMDRYLITLTLRSDGSSTFAEDFRFRTFPSIGLGWVVSEESFFNADVIDFLKIRGSYGELGNNNIPQNEYTQTTSRGGKYSVVLGDGTQIRTGENITSAVAPELQWEIVTEYNFGFEANLFKYKLDIGLDYYRRLTENALFTVLLSGASGSAGSYLDNNADIRNRGIELRLGWSDQINDNFSYRIGGNMTTIDNEVVKLKTGTTGIASGDALHGNLATYTEEGRPIGEFNVLEVIGVFQDKEDVNNYTYTDDEGNTTLIQPIAAPGDLKYKDQNEDGVIDRDDYIRAGSYIPDFTYSFNVALYYKEWDFSMDIYGVAGSKIFNRKTLHRFNDQNENYPKYLVDNRWNAPGSTNQYPSANVGGRQNLLPNTYLVEDGDFIRINSIQLGYTIPWIKGVNRLRLYVNAQNPFTFFKYNGFTPEIPEANPLYQGLDRGVYPISRTISGGVNLNF